ncbi:MAG: type II toxin-antitoxin system VapC family toxin [Acidobacteriota bacterium]
MRVHLDTDFLVYAVSTAGPERRLLLEISESEAQLEMSAVAWYEFSRGPRTAEQLAVARSFFSEDGIIPFSEDIATEAAERFRQLGSPRRRAADIAIGVTAVAMKARLLTRNRRDFAGIEDLRLVEPGRG